MNKAELYEAVVERLTEEGHSAEFHADYSGRFMYGQTTPGIVTNISNTARVGIIIMHIISENTNDVDDAYDEASNMIPTLTDSMGLSSILY